MTKPYTIIRRFLLKFVGMISLDRNDQEVINLLFVLPFGLYLNILKTEKILQKILQRKRLLISRIVPSSFP